MGCGTYTMQGTQRGDPSELLAKAGDVVQGIGVANARNGANRYRRSSNDTVEIREGH